MSNERLTFVYFVLAMAFMVLSCVVPQRTFTDGLLYGIGIGFVIANLLLPTSDAKVDTGEAG